MGLFQLLSIAVGLSMDAFAVSICKGLAMRKTEFNKIAICGVWFGAFQALMPMLGYFLGVSFERFIDSFASWIAFILLALIGGNMIREALESNDGDEADDRLDVKTMFTLAVATSIDALAVGVTFACVPVTLFSGSQLLNTLAAVLIIGATTFTISCVGVKVGNIFGTKYKSKAELAGGAILIIIGLSILLEHYGII